MIFQAGLGLVRQSLATSCAETGLGNEACVSCSREVASEPVASLLLAQERLETGETGTAVDRTGAGGVSSQTLASSPRGWRPALDWGPRRSWIYHAPQHNGSGYQDGSNGYGVQAGSRLWMGLMDLSVLCSEQLPRYRRSFATLHALLLVTTILPGPAVNCCPCCCIFDTTTCITLIHHTCTRTTYAPRHWYAVKPLPRWSLEHLKHLSTRPNYLLI
ncbi:hypothetical protein V8C44DRAFT_71829 [Trichoderma aethiopicum]